MLSSHHCDDKKTCAIINGWLIKYKLGNELKTGRRGSHLLNTKSTRYTSPWRGPTASKWWCIATVVISNRQTARVRKRENCMQWKVGVKWIMSSLSSSSSSSSTNNWTHQQCNGCISHWFRSIRMFHALHDRHTQTHGQTHTHTHSPNVKPCRN